MKRFLNKVPVGVLSAIAIVVIAYISLSPHPIGSGIRLFPHSDKVAHMLMYFFATIMFLMDYAKFKMPHHTKLNVELALMASAMLLGLVMEVLQLIMKIGRGYDIFDLAANCTGALLGFGFMKWKGMHSFRRNVLYSSHRHHHSHGHHHHHYDDTTE